LEQSLEGGEQIRGSGDKAGVGKPAFASPRHRASFRAARTNEVISVVHLDCFESLEIISVTNLPRAWSMLSVHGLGVGELTAMLSDSSLRSGHVSSSSVCVTSKTVRALLIGHLRDLLDQELEFLATRIASRLLFLSE